MALLRLALGVTALTEGLISLSRGVSLESFGLGAILVAAGVLVSIGLFTSYGSMALAIATSFGILLDLPSPLGAVQRGALSSILFTAMATAVALLGPGLFSIDFRLFGHREIVIPRRGQE